jgi:bacillithiol biosynthesis deacetylase BshB1
MKPYDVLAVGAHPDDVEVGCGGALIELSERGRRCALAILTQGEMGTGGDPDIRRAEIETAAHVMGVDVAEVFDWGDTRLADSYEHRLELGQIIRQLRPRIILCPWPQVFHGRRQSHPDHVAAGQITINAANVANLRKAPIEGDIHLVTRIFHYFLPPNVTPSVVVDITPHYDRWMQALAAHQSQFLNPQKGKDYMESLSIMAKSAGALARVKYGQGFATAEPAVVRDITTLADPHPAEETRRLAQ